MDGFYVGVSHLVGCSDAGREKHDLGASCPQGEARFLVGKGLDSIKAWDADAEWAMGVHISRHIALGGAQSVRLPFGTLVTFPACGCPQKWPSFRQCG